jgi:hypothetical protein
MNKITGLAGEMFVWYSIAMAFMGIRRKMASHSGKHLDNIGRNCYIRYSLLRDRLLATYRVISSIAGVHLWTH